jgi:hypothetical protein
MHSTIDAQLPKKVPKQKTCPTPGKWVISDYLLLNCISARKCEILYSFTKKRLASSESLQKPTYKTFKQLFFLYLKLFSSYPLSKVLNENFECNVYTFLDL